MSRAPYQKLSGNGNGKSASSSSSQQRSPKDAAEAADKRRQRHVEDQADPQAPWLTHLEYSIDPLCWTDDLKHPGCELCQAPFVTTLMGSGRHHCRMCGCLCCGACSRGALELPGYEYGEERVCEKCRKSVLALRTFLAKNQETLINNVYVNREAAKFDYWYSGAKEPHLTEIWLSQSLLLLMYKLADGSMEGIPVHFIEDIRTGFSTKELLKRRDKTVCCCFGSIDSEFAAKEACLFSLILQDGRTLDFEAPTPQLRNEWVERLKSLIINTSEFVRYHFTVAQYKVHELIKKEKDRLSPQNIKKLIDEKKSAARAGKNTKSDSIRQKYADKRRG